MVRNIDILNKRSVYNSIIIRYRNGLIKKILTLVPYKNAVANDFS